MKLSYSLLSVPVIYASVMIYKTPTISDAIIVAALSGLAGFLVYLSCKFQTNEVEETELSKLEKELQLERAKLSIEQLKEASLREKALRDSRAAMSGFESGKTIQF